MAPKIYDNYIIDFARVSSENAAVCRRVSAVDRLMNGRLIVVRATFYQANPCIIDSVAGDMGSKLQRF
jgi:hypothetical protein